MDKNKCLKIGCDQLEGEDCKLEIGFHEQCPLIAKKDAVAKLQLQRLVMRFKDLPIGTRFKYPDSDNIWVAIQTYGDGLIVKWEGLIPTIRQSHCCFVDEDWTLESEVEIVC